MAIVHAFKQWRQYLRGASDTITVRSDHENLKYSMTKRALTSRQARWAERLAEFDFVIEYRTGKTNPADGPSRRPDYSDSETIRSSEEQESSLPTLHDKLRVISSLSRRLRSSERNLAIAEMFNRKGALESEPRHLQTGNTSVASIKDHNIQES